jgi:hypothetical protein
VIRERKRKSGNHVPCKAAGSAEKRSTAQSVHHVSATDVERLNTTYNLESLEDDATPKHFSKKAYSKAVSWSLSNLREKEETIIT